MSYCRYSYGIERNFFPNKVVPLILRLDNFIGCKVHDNQGKQVFLQNTALWIFNKNMSWIDWMSLIQKKYGFNMSLIWNAIARKADYCELARHHKQCATTLV